MIFATGVYLGRSREGRNFPPWERKNWRGIGFMPAGGPTDEALSLSSCRIIRHIGSIVVRSTPIARFCSARANGWRRGFNSSPRSAQPHPPSSHSDRGWDQGKDGGLSGRHGLTAPYSGPYDVTLLVIAAAFRLMARGAPLPLWCWSPAFMICLLPMLSPPLLFPVARIAPLFPGLLILLLLLRPPLERT